MQLELPISPHSVSDVGLSPTSCETCLVFKACGGHPLELFRMLGCGNLPVGEISADADVMHPRKAKQFWRYWADVYGLLDYRISAVKPVDSTQLPTYVPLLQHRYSRAETLSSPVVALHLYQVLGRRRGGGYGSHFKNGAELRAYYRLRPDAKVILSGVAADQRLEQFWAGHRKHNVAAQLAVLGISAVTAPNFSFFTDMTGFHRLRNRKRILLVTERLSKAGIPVAPHLNAITDAEWDFWRDFLREHREVSVVTLEFQTGLATNAEGLEAIERVARIQSEIGRLVHPILVGGGQFYEAAARNFTKFTIIDSRPFMEAQMRSVLKPSPDGLLRWVEEKTATPQPIDRHLEKNLELYLQKLMQPEPERSTPIVEDVEGQLSFDSIPYFNAQPVA